MKILICGVGAIGSNLTNRLVADLKNKHEIVVLDFDIVEERNVTPGTQFYSPDQVNLLKVEALQYNIYKWLNREIEIKNEKIEEFLNIGWDLIIDCFDNYEARSALQFSWQKSKDSTIEGIKPFELLHIGFSDNFTFAIEWAENYQVPSNITTGFDICEMEGASSFVNYVASIGSLIAQDFILSQNKIEIIGNKMSHQIVK